MIKKGESLSKRRVSTLKKKKVFLEAFDKAHGVIVVGLKAAQIDRSTYHKWLKADPKFKLACEEAGESAIDFVESKLYENIDKGREISTIFYLKTRAAQRGYYEKTQLDITSGGEKISFNFGNPQIDEAHNIKIDDVTGPEPKKKK